MNHAMNDDPQHPPQPTDPMQPNQGAGMGQCMGAMQHPGQYAQAGYAPPYPRHPVGQLYPNQAAAMGYGMSPGMDAAQQSGPYYQTGYPMSAPQYQQYQQYQQQSSGLFNERFVKGALIGAAAAYLLTNENVQRSAIKGAVKAWSLLQGGVEELKERFHDAEAEIRSGVGE